MFSPLFYKKCSITGSVMDSVLYMEYKSIEYTLSQSYVSMGHKTIRGRYVYMCGRTVCVYDVESHKYSTNGMDCEEKS